MFDVLEPVLGVCLVAWHVPYHQFSHLWEAAVAKNRITSKQPHHSFFEIQGQSGCGLWKAH